MRTGLCARVCLPAAARSLVTMPRSSHIASRGCKAGFFNAMDWHLVWDDSSMRRSPHGAFDKRVRGCRIVGGADIPRGTTPRLGTTRPALADVAHADKRFVSTNFPALCSGVS